MWEKFCRVFSARIFLLLAVAAIVVGILGGQRWLFAARFDAQYMQDWYDHSQWQIPLSPRIMGDAELYQISGYHLAHGDTPFGINPETPPLIKYVYGWSIVTTGNPYWVSIGLYIFTLLGFARLAWLTFPESRRTRWLAIFFFVLSPLFFIQMSQVGLDMPQLGFLLWHLVFVFEALRSLAPKSAAKKSLPFSPKFAPLFFAMAGVNIGAFVATKIGFFTPGILLVDTVLVWRASHNWHSNERGTSHSSSQNTSLKISRRVVQCAWYLLIFLFSAFTMYLAAYTQFFVQHHSLIEWLKNQKYIWSFYFTSKISYKLGMIVPALLWGQFVHWTEGLVQIHEWTIVWPVSFLGVFLWIGVLIQSALQKPMQLLRQNEPLHHDFLLAIVLLTVGLCTLVAVIPFWPRYLLLILPGLCLILAHLIAQRRWLIGVIIVILMAQAACYSFPQPSDTISLSTAAWQSQSFAEVYNFIDSGTQQTIPRANFVATFRGIETALQDAPFTLAVGPVPHTMPWQNTVIIPFTITYHTAMGDVSTTQPLQLTRQANQWRIAWDWQTAFPQFVLNDQILFEPQLPAGGKLLSSDHVLLESGGSEPFISVTPNKIKDIDALIELLTPITHVDGVTLRTLLFVTHAGDQLVPIGFVAPEATTPAVWAASQDPSVTITQRWSRALNPVLQTEGRVKIMSKIDEQHPEVLGKTGGTLKLRTPGGSETTIVQMPTREGKDVTLTQTFEELFQAKYTPAR